MAKYKVLMLEAAHSELQEAARMLRKQAEDLRRLKRRVALFAACVVVLEIVQMVLR